MSLLTVDQIQYNGGTALTLPTATPAAGDLLQTNGSGVLSWRDRLRKVTNAAGTVTYTTPSDVQGGKALGTSGGNAMGWYAGGGDPMGVNGHIGWRLADKIDFNSTIDGYGGNQTSGNPSNISQVNLTLPSGVNASDVSGYILRGTALGFYQANAGVRVNPINSSGTNLISSSPVCNMQWSMSSNNGNNASGSSQNDFISIMDNEPSGFQTSNSQYDTTYGDFNNQGNYSISRRRMNFELQHYNCKYDFGGYVRAVCYRDNSTNKNHAKINVYGSRGNQSFQMSTNHAAGFRVYMYTGAYYRNGMLELYYCLNDGA